MRYINDYGWFFGVFAFVALFAAGSYYLSDDNSGVAESIQFTELSATELDKFIAVKAKMSSYRFTE